MSAHSLSRAKLAEERVLLRDGSTVIFRPLVAGDEGAIVGWFAGLGPETRYARFLGVVKRLDARTRSDLARVDHREHEAVTAVAPDGATVGIARYLRLPDGDTAEVAVAVADRWRGRGIASMLLERLVALARGSGIRHLTAICLASNAAVIHVLSRLGPTQITQPDGGLVELRIELTPKATDI